MTPLDRLEWLFKELFKLPIRFYKRFISKYTPAVCRYYPSCSTYFMQAIEKHGVIKGTVLGVWRILRCNPFARGGVLAICFNAYSLISSSLVIDFSAGLDGAGLLMHIFKYATPVLSVVMLAITVAKSSEITKRALGG